LRSLARKTKFDRSKVSNFLQLETGMR
jgi:hypothetical protein